MTNQHEKPITSSNEVIETMKSELNKGVQAVEKIVLTSAIKKQPSLLRLTRNAVQDQNVEREINHLIKEFVKGNFEAGLGRPGPIQGTDISYLRGRKGGRLYYHKVDENRYEIVCKSAKGRNEDQVINALREIYRH